MTARGSVNPRPMSSSAERSKKVLRGKGQAAEPWWDERAGRDEERDETEEHEQNDEDEQADAADAAELDPQLERAEGEGMVTEHAKVSATDPGPEPLPEPDPEEPEPDHGPGEPDWEAEEERD